MKSTFALGFSPKEIEDMFNEFDQDKDGKLKIEDFIRLLLPADYLLDENNNNNPQKT